MTTTSQTQQTNSITFYVTSDKLKNFIFLSFNETDEDIFEPNTSVKKPKGFEDFLSLYRSESLMDNTPIKIKALDANSIIKEGYVHQLMSYLRSDDVFLIDFHGSYGMMIPLSILSNNPLLINEPVTKIGTTILAKFNSRRVKCFFK